MKEIERVLRGAVADVREQRLSLEEAAGKICADPNLREALVLELRNLVIRAQERDEFLSIRKEAGLKIDPETAEVWWEYGQTLDPYGIDPDLPEEYQQVGREYFARSPGSDIWVSFHDLPEETRNALWKRHKTELAFPAGLEQMTEYTVAQSEVGSPLQGQAPRRTRTEGSPKNGTLGGGCEDVFDGVILARPAHDAPT
jgi:hypothetical protein